MSLFAFCLLSMALGGNGVTKSSSISDFWTDDYKVFEQVYGKTSDKDLYGDTLPVSSKTEKVQKTAASAASEKKERYVDHQDFIDFDSYKYGNRYTKLFPKLKLEDIETTTKAKLPSSLNFISLTNFKPINQYNDPETYNYLKNLEEQKIKYSDAIPLSGIKFYPTFLNNPEDRQAYRSIQDILDAHEANKGNKNISDEDEQTENPKFGPGNGRKKSNARKKPGGEYNKPRCWSGRCRKRSAVSVRVRSRPYIRKIIQNRWVSGY